MKKPLAFALFAALLGAAPSARASFLYNGFLEPSFYGGANTEYSAWDVLYTPYGNPNLPDVAAPYGNWTTATAAGATAPANSSPANPAAYWDARNPTITQVATSSAFIIGPGSSGNIYSFAAPLRFELQDTTPYALGTVLFQYQSDGTMADFSSIKLQYTDGSGATVQLAPDERLREYQSSGSSYGGFGNRTALEWDLTGLGITSYQIVLASSGPSMSFQMASLDTSATFTPVIPGSRSWNGGNGLWSSGGNWAEGTSSNQNGNVKFVNAGPAAVTLDTNRTVGELTFDTAADVEINPTGGSVLTANTGISTTTAATGRYRINADYKLGSFNLFEIDAGTVELNGVVSGGYGLFKSGSGTLVLANNNTFTGSVAVEGGVLRLEGTNSYAGSTSVLWGTLVAASDSLPGLNGALGSDTTAVNLGADSALYEYVGAGDAALLIEGNHTLGRDIALAAGDFPKTLGAGETGAGGATFSGAVTFAATSTNIHLKAAGAADKLIFTGAISGGATTGVVTLDGAGTVVYSGAEKTYGNRTTVASGALVIDEGTAFTGAGAVAVSSGARLVVNGTLGGGGTLALDHATVSGSGTISRAFALASGSVISPGSDGIGTLHTASQTWGGGAFKLEISSTAPGAGAGSDLVAITGSLSLTADAATPFTLSLSSLTLAGGAGAVDGFDAGADYSWTFLTTTGGITGFDSQAFRVDAGGFLGAGGGSFSVSRSGNDLTLHYAAVPEPSTWALLATAAASLAMVRRRSFFKP